MDVVLENCSQFQSDVWDPTPLSSIHSNHSQSSLVVAGWRNEVVELLKDKRARKITTLILFCGICYCILLTWCLNTRSMALLAYTYTVGFSLLSLLICILTLWVERQSPSPLFTFGYDRFEVLAVFASTVVGQLASLFILKESMERLVVEQPQIHINGILLGAGIAFVCHLMMLYGCSHTALNHVAAASTSSWLQEHVSDMSQSLCSFLPALSGILLPRVHPMLLVACTGSLSLVLTDVLIELKGCYVVDTFAGMWIALALWATMLPMTIYSGKVLMQTTPSHLVGQLDKCLRETLTIDGVLEFRNEHFWTLSFGKMAGCLHVRVRRDANEQMVLAHVIDRLSSVVSLLTVQVFRDEWSLRRIGNTAHNVGVPTNPFKNAMGHVPYTSHQSSNKLASPGFNYSNFQSGIFVENNWLPSKSTLFYKEQ